MNIGGVTITGATISEPPPAPTSGNLRAVLSAAGQSSYDSAATGNFFSVSTADYESVVSSLSGVTRVGLPETASGMNANNVSAYSGTCASLYDISNSTIAVNSFILGYSARVFTASGNLVLLSCTTFQGNYTAVANQAPVTTTGRMYYLRKNPSAVGNTTYVGIVSTVADFRQSVVSITGAAFDCSSPYSSWNARNGTMPVLQILQSTIQHW